MNIKMGNGSSILMSDKGESVKSISQDDKALIAKQAEQIKMLRADVEAVRKWFEINGYIASCVTLEKLLESTKGEA